MKLSNKTLERITAEVGVPNYNRDEVTPGIVHIGVGHFHRAHEALYMDDLLSVGAGGEWGIAGLGVAAGSEAIRDALVAQDCLYTLTEKSSDGEWSSRVIGSIVSYYHAPDDIDAALELLARPSTKVISLTITEGGYDIDNRTGEFLASAPAVVADLATEAGTSSVFGLVTQALRRRRDRGVGPLTIMSCDNVQGNGHVAKSAFLGFARRADPELADWIEKNVTFPNSMVDRVTPGTTDADRNYLVDHYGIEDAWPVTSEPFRQWVLEDKFAAGRPPLEQVGVEVVEDVVPYELMKLRLANGTHQALCYFGTLLGYTYVHEAVADDDIHAMLLRYIDEEAVPTLAEIPGYDFHSYGRTVLERFGNPQVRDTLARICEDTSDRIPKFLLPVVFSQLDSEGQTEVCAAVVASWARYAEGVGENGETLDVRDPLRDDLMPRASRQRVDTTAFLENRAVFGDLIDRSEFASTYSDALRMLHESGARALLRSLARTS